MSDQQDNTEAEIAQTILADADIDEAADKKPAAKGDEQPAKKSKGKAPAEKPKEDASKEANAEGSEGEGSDDEGIEYEDFTLPEGMEVDEEGMKLFKTEIKAFNGGKGLSQEDAQKLIDMHTKVMSEAVAAQQQQWTELTNQWIAEIKDDKDYGGPKFKETQAEILLAAQEYGDTEFVEILKREPAFANRPAFVRFLANVGRTLKEDQAQRGRNAKPIKDIAERMYPSS